jgi:hypothetical protein
MPPVSSQVLAAAPEVIVDAKALQTPPLVLLVTPVAA